jgi:hypothetical protein
MARVLWLLVLLLGGSSARPHIVYILADDLVTITI